jgi:hypothetical protein
MDTPTDYALRLVQQGFTAQQYWTHVQDLPFMDYDYMVAVVTHMATLPTTEEYYNV